MKRFDYNNAYLHMKHGEEPVQDNSEQGVAKPVKKPAVREVVEAPVSGTVTPEQQAIEKANAEKSKAQDDVNGVLYQDTRPKKSIRVAKSDSQPVQTPDESVTQRFEQDSCDEDNKSTEEIAVSNGSNVASNDDGSHYSDSVVDDFRNNFDNSSDDDAVLVRPGEVITSKPTGSNQAQSVSQESASAPVQHSTPRYAPTSDSEITIADKNSIGVSQPKIYTDLAERVQSMFPSAGGAADAINAYLYIKLGKPADIPITKQLKDVVDHYIGDGTDDYYIESDMNEILEKVMTLQSNDKAVMQKLELLEVLTAYLLCEYNGYVVADRNGNQHKGPADLKLCNSHVQALINNLESIGAGELANWKLGKTSRTSASGRRMT